MGEMVMIMEMTILIIIKYIIANGHLPQEHNVSFSGGTGKTTYYISSNYLNQKGFIAYGERYI